MNLKNKRILITAGPTWVPIDDVRVITNIATGTTGALLANELNKYGASVTLVLGPVIIKNLNKKIKMIPFRFFDELNKIVKKELKTGKYNAVVHSAAVSDYKPAVKVAGKIKSGSNDLKLVLKPTEKIIDSIKHRDPCLFLVGFKFEPGVSKDILIKRANELLKRAKLDLTIANTVIDNGYKAYILNKHEITGPFLDKKSMVKNLAKKIGSRLCPN